MSTSATTLALMLVAALACSGCHPDDQSLTSPTHPASTARAVKITPDGLTIDDPRWESIPSQPMTLDAARIADGHQVSEPGGFRFAYDNKAIYLRVDFTDHDVVSNSRIGTHMLFRAGDVAEWFIGTPPSAAGQPGSYYELHVAPDHRLAAFRIDRPGAVKAIEPLPFSAEVSIDGALNTLSGRDASWSAMFILPWDAIEKLDPSYVVKESFPPRLTVLVGRHNYEQHVPNVVDIKERTMWPTQSKTAFHMRNYHAPLVFEE